MPRHLEGKHYLQAVSLAASQTVWRLSYSMFLDSIDESFATHIEISSCACLVPIAFVKRLYNKLLLDRFQADALRRQVYFESVNARSFLCQEFRQVFDGDFVSSGQNNNTLYDIREFAHITRPSISGKIGQ